MPPSQSLTISMSCLSVLMLRPCGHGIPDLCLGFPLSWVPKPTWLHLILVDICLSEKGARDDQWEEGPPHSPLPV